MTLVAKQKLRTSLASPVTLWSPVEMLFSSLRCEGKDYCFSLIFFSLSFLHFFSFYLSFTFLSSPFTTL